MDRTPGVAGPVVAQAADLGALGREALAKRIDQRSTLRELADEIGISFGNLGRFLRQETSPQRKTRDLLVRWYYARAERVPEAPREDRDNAIAVLRAYVGDASKPRSVRERRMREVLQLLEKEPE